MGQGYKGFYRKRFLKIAPLYYLSLILAAFIPSIQQHDVWDIGSHVFFLNGLNPYCINTFHVEWYIADLALFYFLIPVLAIFVNSRKSAFVALVVSIVLSVLVTVLSKATAQALSIGI